MRTCRIVTVLALFLVSTPSSWAQHSAPAVAPTPLRFPEVVGDARELVETALVEEDYPGIAIAVSVEGQTVWSEGFGYADLEHRIPMTPAIKFRVGSIAKPMTAAAVVTLVEAGQLDLDAPIQRYVASFPEKRQPITTRQLGGHLAGIRHYDGDEMLIRDRYDTVTASLAIFKNDPLLHAPGTKYSYSSYGYNLISAVIEGASGQNFLSYMREAVFRPLAMNQTVADHVTSLIPHRAGFYQRNGDGALVNAPYVNNSYKWAGGGFLSTTEDVLRFANAHLEDAFLSASQKEILFMEQRTTDGAGVGYGFGWFVRADDAGWPLLSHSGGSIGGTSLMVMQPDTGVVVVGLVNQGQANLDVFREVLRRFVRAAAGR